MFDEEKWDKNDWIESQVVQEYFKMTFIECLKEFGFNRQAEWNKPPSSGQKITAFFRKYK